jgi:hypothetical protein
VTCLGYLKKIAGCRARVSELLKKVKERKFQREMKWVIGCWVLIGIVVGWYWFKKKSKIEKRSGLPRGNLGWPFVGETLDFIACGYTSRPVSFMDKRKSL